MFPELYVLRHGETEWNVAGRFQGHLDSALTARGVQQAARQAEILSGIDFAAFDLLSSPQGRALRTARLALAGHGAVRPEPQLREIGLGDWAGRTRADLAAESPVPMDGFALYEHAPGGEGFVALEARCGAFLRRLDRPAVLVTHGMTSRMIRAVALGPGRDAIAHVGGGQGVVYRVVAGKQFLLE